MRKPQSRAGWFFRSFFILVIAGTVLGTMAVGGLFWHFSRNLPKMITLADYRPMGVTEIIGKADGKDALIGEFYTQRRYVLPIEKIPDLVIKAFISAEDDQFFQHQGVNIASMIRAGIANFRAGHVAQGGSTITQQVVKSLLLTPERSFVRKIKEVILANKIERTFTKQQILYLYLNQIYLGRGAYGVQGAARAYFGKNVSELTLAEAAILAGMPQAPSKYSPHLNPKKAKERQLYVLRRMYENKQISQAQMTEAAAQPVRIIAEEDINKKYAPYLVEHIRRYLAEKYGDKAIWEDGLTVYVPTTRELSLAAMKSIQDGLRTIDKRMGYRGPLQQLKDDSQIEEFLKNERLDLIMDKVRFQLFLPDGRTDWVEAMHAAGYKSDSELLKEGDIRKAVVIGTDDKRKVASVLIGAVKAELPLEKMKWARPSKDGKPIGPEPSLPSKALSRGDVILVQVLKNAEGQVVAGLEQDPEVQGALFSMDVHTGCVLAMVGGYSYKGSEFNRVTQAQRQPGSAFKPIIYSAAIEKGYTPASIIIDAPLTFEDAQFGKWKPSNYEEKFYGDTTFRQALIKSRNIPTIRLVQDIQVPYLIDYAKRLGLSAHLDPDLSISLGTSTLSPYELTKVFALYPRLGRRVEPIFILKVVDREGKILEEHPIKPLLPPVIPPLEPVTAAAAGTPDAMVSPSPAPAQVPSTALAQGRVDLKLPTYPPANDPEQVMDPRVAYVMTYLMNEVVNFGTGFEAKSLGRPAAGKTGTTSDYIDAWFVGFTPQVLTTSWVGYDSQKSIGPGETGAKAALPIWLDFMREAVKTYAEANFTIPQGVVFTSIDPNTGKLANSNSTKAIKEVFIEGTQPTKTSSQDSGESQGEFLKEDFQ